MGIWDGLKRDWESFIDSLTGRLDPRAYSAGGLKVSCPHCGSDGFRARGEIGNYTVLICDRCGLAQRFAKRPEPIPAKSKVSEGWPDV